MVVSLDIEMNDCLFIYKLFDKRDSFSFHIVRMPDKTSNIPDHVFYGTISSEFLRIARSTLLFIDFLPRAVNLCKRMLIQGGEVHKIFRQYSKTMANYFDVFDKYLMAHNIIISHIKELLWRMVVTDHYCWGAMVIQLYCFEIPETVPW